jgi:tungstate transport system substrate-binding protein
MQTSSRGEVLSVSKRAPTVLAILALFGSIGLSCCGRETPGTAERTAVAPSSVSGVEAPRLVVAYPTRGAHDSGLLRALGFAFEAQEGVSVLWHPHGSSEPASLGAQADVLFSVTSREDLETARNARVVWVERLLVIGPPLSNSSYGEFNYSSGMRRRGLLGGRGALLRADAARLLHALRRTGFLFVSRGDESIVHQRELALWGEEGPPGDRVYVETGKDMAATLQAANAWAVEKSAYTLTDEVTFLLAPSPLVLHVVLGEDPALELFVIARWTDRHPDRAAVGSKFLAWLESDRARDVIRNTRVKGHRPFFLPDEARQWTLRGRLDPERESDPEVEDETPR